MTIDLLGSNYLITELAEHALDAFWQAIGRQFPVVKTGDLSPDCTIALQAAAEAALSEWIANNVARLQ